MNRFLIFALISQIFSGVFAHDFSIVVVDDAGVGIPNVNLNFTIGDGERNKRHFQSTSDQTGKVTVAVDPNFERFISLTIQKSGYYQTWICMADTQGKLLKVGNVLKVRFRSIDNPISMYSRNVSISLPEWSKPCGFDLIAADWVAPYGKGAHSDFIFTGTQIVPWKKNANLMKEGNEEKLALSFPGKNDGIIVTEWPMTDRGSEFRFLREAPTDGYQPTWLCHLWWRPKTMEVTPPESRERGFYFRIRTDDNVPAGESFGGMYGKITTPIEFNPSGSIAFTYYLNDTGTRNLEADPKRSKFGNLPPMQGRSSIPELP